MSPLTVSIDLRETLHDLCARGMVSGSLLDDYLAEDPATLESSPEPRGLTPPAEACTRGDMQGLQVAELLLAKGAKANTVCATGAMTALHCATASASPRRETF